MAASGEDSPAGGRLADVAAALAGLAADAAGGLLDQDTLLAAVASVRGLGALAEQCELALLDAARIGGSTWAGLAAAMGAAGRQTAQKRRADLSARYPATGPALQAPAAGGAEAGPARGAAQETPSARRPPGAPMITDRVIADGLYEFARQDLPDGTRAYLVMVAGRQAGQRPPDLARRDRPARLGAGRQRWRDVRRRGHRPRHQGRQRVQPRRGSGRPPARPAQAPAARPPGRGRCRRPGGSRIVTGSQQPGAGRAVLLPDLDDDLTAALGEVETLLQEVRAWEEEVPATRWPAPLAGGAALAALGRIWDAVAPGQGDRAAAAGFTGRLLAPADAVTLPGRSLTSPGGTYEHAPLRLASVDPADVAALAGAARVFGDPAGPWFARQALENAGRAVHGDDTADAGTRLVMTAARVAGLLDLEPDADTEALARVVGAAAPAADIILDREGEAAYGRYARRANAMWALSDPLSLYLY